MVRGAILSLAGVLAGAGLARADDAAPLRSAIDGTFAPRAMPKIRGGLEGFNIDLVDEMSKRIHRPNAPRKCSSWKGCSTQTIAS